MLKDIHVASVQPNLHTFNSLINAHANTSDVEGAREVMQPSGGWVCGTCTARNVPDASMCEVCGTPSEHFQGTLWEYEDDKGQWKPYSTDICAALNEQGRYTFTIPPYSQQYEVSTSSMLQWNTVTNKTRRIRSLPERSQGNIPEFQSEESSDGDMYGLEVRGARERQTEV